MPETGDTRCCCCCCCCECVVGLSLSPALRSSVGCRGGKAAAEEKEEEAEAEEAVGRIRVIKLGCCGFGLDCICVWGCRWLMVNSCAKAPPLVADCVVDMEDDTESSESESESESSELSSISITGTALRRFFSFFMKGEDEEEEAMEEAVALV